MITSLSNERVKNIRKLRDRKFRKETNLFYIEGIRIVVESLEQKAEVQFIIITPELMRTDAGQQILEKCAKDGVEVTQVSNEVFSKLSLKEHPQGIGAVVKQEWQVIDRLQNGISGIWVALYEIADPGNLGTIIRTADGTGSSGIMLIDNCTDPYDPAAVRASMGAVFNIQLIKTASDSFVNLVNTIKIPVFGTSDSAGKDYRGLKYPNDMVLLMGSEREGINPGLLSTCNSLLSIPMMGTSDSLNLAVATGVFLYEILAQHKSKESGGRG